MGRVVHPDGGWLAHLVEQPALMRSVLASGMAGLLLAASCTGLGKVGRADLVRDPAHQLRIAGRSGP